MIWGLKSAGGLDIFSIQGGSNFAGGYFFSGGLGLLKKSPAARSLVYIIQLLDKIIIG